MTASPTPEKNKTLRLILGLFFDLLGMVSYSLPLVGESADLLWAPISGFLLLVLYRREVSSVWALIAVIEEAVPLLDFIPTFTLAWLYRYYFKSRLSTTQKATDADANPTKLKDNT